jgi:hypothetical protein
MGTDLVFAVRGNWTRRWQVLSQAERSIREQQVSDHSSNIEWLPGAGVRVPAEVLEDFRYYVESQLEDALAWLAESFSTEPSERPNLRRDRDACLWVLGILDEHEGTHSVVRDGYVEVTKAVR